LFRSRRWESWKNRGRRKIRDGKSSRRIGGEGRLKLEGKTAGRKKGRGWRGKE
jgi:hypothetical protein